MRELRVLQSCRHPNLVELKKVVTGKKLDRCRQCTHSSALCGSIELMLDAAQLLLCSRSVFLVFEVRCGSAWTGP